MSSKSQEKDIYHALGARRRPGCQVTEQSSPLSPLPLRGKVRLVPRGRGRLSLGLLARLLFGHEGFEIQPVVIIPSAKLPHPISQKPGPGLCAFRYMQLLKDGGIRHSSSLE